MDEVSRSECMSETESESRRDEKPQNGIHQGICHCCIMGFLLGSITCGIALSIVIVMFVQDSQRFSTMAINNTSLSWKITTSTTATTVTTETTSTTATTVTTETTTTTSTISTTTTTLPNECSSYTFINDVTRLTTSGLGSGCDNSFSTLTWVRFTGSGGTKIADSPPTMYSCGTYYPGWYTGSYPAATFTSTGAVCFVYLSYTCMWASGISVTNCGGYYVYGLTNVPGCYMRYCTV